MLPTKLLQLALGTADDLTVTSVRMPPTMTTRDSRAVMRTIEPGNDASCSHCDLPVKFAARVQLRQVIANIYVDGRWDRVEHFHPVCYDEAGLPYGALIPESSTSGPGRSRR